MAFLADLPRAVDSARDAALATYHRQQDIAEQVEGEAQMVAYRALEATDPTAALLELDWCAGDYLQPYAGEPGGYFPDAVLLIIRDLRLRIASPEEAARRLLMLGDRIADEVAAKPQVVARAYADVLSDYEEA